MEHENVRKWRKIGVLVSRYDPYNKLLHNKDYSDKNLNYYNTRSKRARSVFSYFNMYVALHPI